jgi:hypothetical protein
MSINRFHICREVMIIDFLHQNSQLSEDKRRQLAQQIFHEVQEGYYQSSIDFYRAVSNELGNISDQAIDILVRQKKLYD